MEREKRAPSSLSFSLCLRRVVQCLIHERRDQLPEIGRVRYLLNHVDQHKPGIGIDEVIRSVRPSPSVGADRAQPKRAISIDGLETKSKPETGCRMQRAALV